MTTPLLTDLVSYWQLDEEGGDRADEVGGNTLTDVNTVIFETGKRGNAAKFTSANLEQLTHIDNASLSVGDIDFTWSFWCYLTAKTTNRDLISKFQNNNNTDYRIYYDATADRFRGQVSDAAGNVSLIRAENLGSPSVDTWYHVIFWHSATDNQVGIIVNDGTPDIAATNGPANDGTYGLSIGATSAGANFMDGDIDEAGFWKRLLTNQEKSWLYNGGYGRSWEEIQAYTGIEAGMMFWM